MWRTKLEKGLQASEGHFTGALVQLRLDAVHENGEEVPPRQQEVVLERRQRVVQPRLVREVTQQRSGSCRKGLVNALHECTIRAVLCTPAK